MRRRKGTRRNTVGIYHPAYDRRNHEPPTPLSLKCDPTLLPEAKHKDGMDKAAEVLLTLQVGTCGNGEIDHTKLVERTIFALRGFGKFQSRRGI